MNGWLAAWSLCGESPLWSAACVAFAGTLTGAMSMLLYTRLSPQPRIAELGAQAAEARSALHRFDGDDLRVIWSLTRHSIGCSLRQAGLILAPALGAALPVLGAAWLTVLAFDRCEGSLAPGSAADWLFSGHVAFWVPLGVSALAVKWAYGIK
jgi:hypothetical protein